MAVERRKAQAAELEGVSRSICESPQGDEREAPRQARHAVHHELDDSHLGADERKRRAQLSLGGPRGTRPTKTCSKHAGPSSADGMDRQ